MSRRSTEKTTKRFGTGATIIGLVLFDVVMGFIGYFTGFFEILVKTEISENPIIYTYEVNNSYLMIIIAICLINVLIVYHLISSTIFHRHLSSVDESGHVSEGLSRVEAHLINYDKETIAFEHLSAIEQEVGATHNRTHNEIWVITNNFEERHDSEEGKELRTAIINNLATNVDYYYIVSEKNTAKLDALVRKLQEDLRKRRIRNLSGQFFLYYDNTFDFLPTPYYDILLYIKGSSDGTGSIETSSQYYYCFSRKTNAKECYYQKVEEKDVWERLSACVKEYKKKIDAPIDLLKSNNTSGRNDHLANSVELEQDDATT